MTLQELLKHFDEGGIFGDDPEIIIAMRQYIQENRDSDYAVSWSEWLAS